MQPNFLLTVQLFSSTHDKACRPSGLIVERRLVPLAGTPHDEQSGASSESASSTQQSTAYIDSLGYESVNLRAAWDMLCDHQVQARHAKPAFDRKSILPLPE